MKHIILPLYTLLIITLLVSCVRLEIERNKKRQLRAEFGDILLTPDLTKINKKN